MPHFEKKYIKELSCKIKSECFTTFVRPNLEYACNRMRSLYQIQHKQTRKMPTQCCQNCKLGLLKSITFLIRDQPFNLKGGYVFLFQSEFFFRTTRELEYLFYLSRKARNFFSEFNIRFYDKNWFRLFFFPPPKSEYFFQQHWESEYFFRKKT
jgi:hypothetical protein